MSILKNFITQSELERFIRLTTDNSRPKGSVLFLVFDLVVGNIESAFDDAIKKSITDRFPHLTELDLEDVQAQANAELGDVFVGLDLFETGVIVSPEMAAVIRNQLRDGELTVIDTRACALYEQMKNPLRNGIIEELRQDMNNH